jgi:methylated-DNA-[protein]-cysteine S-methyltransferase
MWQTDLMLEWTEVKVIDGIDLRLVASASGICAIEFVQARRPAPPSQRNDANALLLEAALQLRAYFAGELHEFRLPLDLQGTAFQQLVWRQVATIPYGETRSYLQIATAIGSPQGVRAVGAANGANPVPIVIPCHRVIGANGNLVGYGGGLPLKKRLLELEGALAMPLAL